MTITATCQECGQSITLPDVDADCPKDKLEFLKTIIVCNDCVGRKRAAQLHVKPLRHAYRDAAGREYRVPHKTGNTLRR